MIPVPGIYVIWNTANQRAYVGSSKNVEVRRHQHLSALYRGSHHEKTLQSDWRLLGPAAFTFSLLEPTDQRSAQLAKRERYWHERFAKIGIPLYGSRSVARAILERDNQELDHIAPDRDTVDDPLLTVRQVAQRLQVAEVTIRRWIATGRLKAAARITRRSGWRIRTSEVERLLNQPDAES